MFGQYRNEEWPRRAAWAEEKEKERLTPRPMAFICLAILMAFAVTAYAKYGDALCQHLVKELFGR